MGRMGNDDCGYRPGAVSLGAPVAAAPSLMVGSQAICSVGNGGGRGAYSCADGGFPVACRGGFDSCRIAAPSDVPAQAVAQRSFAIGRSTDDPEQAGPFDSNDVPAQAVAQRSDYHPGHSRFVPGADFHVCRGGGGRGMYAREDGDLPVALCLAGPLASTERTGPLPRTERTSRSALPPGSSDEGRGRAAPAARGGFDYRNETGAPNAGALPDTCIMHVNIQGLRSHLAELCAVIRLSAAPPDIVCVNETFLDEGIEEIALEGFDVVGRRDRSHNGDERKCGGVIVYARSAIANHVTLISISGESERLWLQMHTNNGPYLLCAWYRPPVQGEVDSITSFDAELDQLRGNVLGTLLVGDLNLHLKRWLVHSANNTKEGELMRDICLKTGLRQMVREPTRGDHLLDLVVTDIESTSVFITSQIADHCVITARLNLSIPRTASHSRTVWSFNKANWEGMNEELRAVDFSSCIGSPAAHSATELILEVAMKYIPQRQLRTTKRSHPWLTDDIVSLVQAKQAAAGTAAYEDSVKVCSAAILKEYNTYCLKARRMLVEARRGSKPWWSLSRELLLQQARVESIPALKSSDGYWVHESGDKAELLAGSFGGKCILPGPITNEYSHLELNYCRQKSLKELTVGNALDTLADLDESSATGPDLLPARVLKQCRYHLAGPILQIALAILNSGQWPPEWRIHWVVPIFKRGAVYLPKNYRGVHLTSQLSKVVERLFLSLMSPHIDLWSLSGYNQFAYTKKRGARDILVLLTMRWVMALDKGMKILVYCSDVSGAFDRVSSERLLAKLTAKGIHPKMVKLIGSWLEPRSASVVVGGAKSRPFTIKDMVFQGTVLGPQLWNLFFEDAKRAINEFFYEEMVFADDLNAFKVVPSRTTLTNALASIDLVQQELHKWGDANQVTFDPAKESKHVLSRSEPFGEDFKLLGVVFDNRLDMDVAVKTLAGKVRWKTKMLLRSKRSFNVEDMVVQYKQQILSFIEFRTGAIYHATLTVLRQLDYQQHRFLRELGITPEAALHDFNLAPLQMRRDIAMLGVLHRAALREGPLHFQEFFKRHPGSLRLVDPLANCDASLLMKRSIWGLVRVYNTLGGTLQCGTVPVFQKHLQDRAKSVVAKQLLQDWPTLYSGR